MTKIKEHYARWVLTRAFLAHVERFRCGPVVEKEETCVGDVRPVTNSHWLSFVGSKSAVTRGRMERDQLKHAHKSDKKAAKKSSKKGCNGGGNVLSASSEPASCKPASASGTGGWQFSQGRKGRFSSRSQTASARADSASQDAPSSQRAESKRRRRKARLERRQAERDGLCQVAKVQYAVVHEYFCRKYASMRRIQLGFVASLKGMEVPKGILQHPSRDAGEKQQKQRIAVNEKKGAKGDFVAKLAQVTSDRHIGLLPFCDGDGHFVKPEVLKKTFLWKVVKPELLKKTSWKARMAEEFSEAARLEAKEKAELARLKDGLICSKAAAMAAARTDRAVASGGGGATSSVGAGSSGGAADAVKGEAFIVYIKKDSKTVTVPGVTPNTDVGVLHAAVTSKTGMDLANFYLLWGSRKLPSSGATLDECGVRDDDAHYCSLQLRSRGRGGMHGGGGGPSSECGMDTSRTEGHISLRLTRKRGPSSGKASMSISCGVVAGTREMLAMSEDDEYVQGSSENGSDEDDDSDGDGPMTSRNAAGKRRAVMYGDRSARTSDGMGRRTGAKLAIGVRDEGELQAVTVMVERQNSLMSKAKSRPTHKLVAEMPVGTVDVASMPCRYDYAAGDEGTVQFQQAYGTWHRESHNTSVVQQRWASAKEYKSGMINDWLVTNGHDAFAEWRQDEASNSSLHLIVENGVPKPPSAEAVCTWAYNYCIGNAKKGGRPEYRAQPQYGLRLGQTQDKFMPTSKEGKYGHGAFKNEPPRFTTIEQTLSGLRQWLKQQLRNFPRVANPCDAMMVREVTRHLESEVGRAVVEERLPRVLKLEELNGAIACARVTEASAGSLEKAIEETQNLLYITKNSIQGVRAHDEYLLDMGDVRRVVSDGSGSKSGQSFQYVSTKNNKTQQTRKKMLQCSEACQLGQGCAEGCGGKSLVLTDDGTPDPAQFCVACLVEHLKELVGTLLGESCPPHVPVYGTFRRVKELQPGSTLVVSEEGSCVNEAPLLVCGVTKEEEALGFHYNRTVPFTVNGKEYYPAQRGVWFELGATGYACRTWADAAGVTAHLRKQLTLVGERTDVNVGPLQKVTSKTMRRTMATIMSRHLSVPELMALGEWSSEAMLRRYIERLDAFSMDARNYTDVVFGGAPLSSGGSTVDAGSDGGTTDVEAAGSQPALSRESSDDVDAQRQRAMQPVQRQSTAGRMGHREKEYSETQKASIDERRRPCHPRAAGERNPLTKSVITADVEKELLASIWEPTAGVRAKLCAAGCHVSLMEVESFRNPRRSALKKLVKERLAACSQAAVNSNDNTAGGLSTGGSEGTEGEEAFVVYVKVDSSTVSLPGMTPGTDIGALHAALAAKTGRKLDSFYLLLVSHVLPSSGVTLRECGVHDDDAHLCTLQLRARLRGAGRNSGGAGTSSQGHGSRKRKVHLSGCHGGHGPQCAGCGGCSCCVCCQYGGLWGGFCESPPADWVEEDMLARGGSEATSSGGGPKRVKEGAESNNEDGDDSDDGKELCVHCMPEMNSCLFCSYFTKRGYDSIGRLLKPASQQSGGTEDGEIVAALHGADSPCYEEASQELPMSHTPVPVRLGATAPSTAAKVATRNANGAGSSSETEEEPEDEVVVVNANAHKGATRSLETSLKQATLVPGVAAGAYQKPDHSEGEEWPGKQSEMRQLSLAEASAQRAPQPVAAPVAVPVAAAAARVGAAAGPSVGQGAAAGPSGAGSASSGGDNGSGHVGLQAAIQFMRKVGGPNEGQLRVLRAVLLPSSTPKQIVVIGPPGTGKSTLLQACIRGVLAMRERACCIAEYNPQVHALWEGLGVIVHALNPLQRVRPRTRAGLFALPESGPLDAEEVMNEVSCGSREELTAATFMFEDEYALCQPQRMDCCSSVCQLVRRDPRAWGGMNNVKFGDPCQGDPIIDERDLDTIPGLEVQARVTITSEGVWASHPDVRYMVLTERVRFTADLLVKGHFQIACGTHALGAEAFELRKRGTAKTYTDDLYVHTATGNNAKVMEIHNKKAWGRAERAGKTVANGGVFHYCDEKALSSKRTTGYPTTEQLKAARSYGFEEQVFVIGEKYLVVVKERDTGATAPPLVVRMGPSQRAKRMATNLEVVTLEELVFGADKRLVELRVHVSGTAPGMLMGIHREAHGNARIESFPIKPFYERYAKLYQGLQFDEFHVDTTQWHPMAWGMLGMAVSRVKSLDGLKLTAVGKDQFLRNKCTANWKVVLEISKYMEVPQAAVVWAKECHRLWAEAWAREDERRAR